MLFLLKKYYLLFYILSIFLILIFITTFGIKYQFYFGNNYLVHFCDVISCFLTTLCISYKYEVKEKKSNYFNLWSKIYISLYNVINKPSAVAILIFYLFIYFFISFRWISIALTYEINLYKVSTTLLICIFKYIVAIYIIIRIFINIQIPLLIVLKKFFWKNKSISEN
jgi:hypothetical protein